MNDMRAVIQPKSDQLNADSLIGGPLTITVTEVTIRAGTEQPVSVGFEGDGGRPYKPCKSMCKVMVTCWGPDANAYAGRSMTLFSDPDVKWGGMAVGGIRISHITHIDAPKAMALTETKGKKKMFIVQPLKVDAPPPKADKNADAADRLIAQIQACTSEDDLNAIAGDAGKSAWRTKMRTARPELDARIAATFGDRYAAMIATTDDTPFTDETA